MAVNLETDFQKFYDTWDFIGRFEKALGARGLSIEKLNLNSGVIANLIVIRLATDLTPFLGLEVSDNLDQLLHKISDGKFVESDFKELVAYVLEISAKSNESDLELVISNIISDLVSEMYNGYQSSK